MKRLIMAVAVATSMTVMMVLLAAPTWAQTTYSDDVQGTEYAAVSGQSGSFVGRASGGLPGVMNVTVTYAGGSPGPNVTESITGGDWSLSGRWGRVFGSFSGGTVQWNADGTLANIEADMSVSGGSVSGVPISGGSGTFGGVLDHRPLAQHRPPKVAGTLRLVLS